MEFNDKCVNCGQKITKVALDRVDICFHCEQGISIVVENIMSGTWT